MSLAPYPLMAFEADPAALPRSIQGECTWELVSLFPRQGDWSPHEFESFQFDSNVQFDHGALIFKHVIPEVEDGPPHSEPGDWTWEMLARFPRQGRWSKSDFLALQTNQLIEFTEGTLEFLPKVTPRHQDLVLFLRDRLVQATQSRAGRTFVAPLRIRLKSGREPEVIFARPEHVPDRRKPVIGADLVIEVVSGSPSDRHRDFVIKRDDYAGAGIPEYWIVDPDLQQITILVLDEPEAAYNSLGCYRPGDCAASQLIPEFFVDVAECFAAGSGPSQGMTSTDPGVSP